MIVYDLSKQLVMGCGNSKTPLYAVLGTSVLNILLDLAWVGPFGGGGHRGGHRPFPGGGVPVHAVVSAPHPPDGPFRPAMLDRRCLWEVFRLAAPSAIQQASAPGGAA